MTRMPTSNTPKAAIVDDAPMVSRTLARAFVDDPMMSWFFPDEASREAGLGRYFITLFTRQYGLHGVCERTDAAAAFWVAPEGQEKAVPDAATVRELQEILGDRAELFRAAVEAAAEHTPPEPHWYLAVIGADPAARGQGHGSALLRSGLAKADAAGMPVYLESSKPDNLPVYEHFGFVVLGEASLPGGGPTLWAMRRAPQEPSGA
ncbi:MULTISPECIES: GNAT family N-acetyltransferase [Streptomyces]|uniref:Puromycin N-acetyltransferase, putative n=1 Tax=Streptomyces venezuelae (strain ATCC 10712 / CBS 650.69 / DSM 40230 / JCM 4526 / NBRC 13096 / PD 04745) TaxID=953739 RepID=F2RIM0_STRVP|nr:GNAT family N-acetyltransferase [Streptomyces venezuelae]APE23272.1 GNAT family N-acetyltransferase [Streptomyces venezuelae]QES00650.1 N-acetyltransferase [Streptomyces venezuelae ATCC 10712]CCA57576.1 puromycin N-acetyltransferase, putative [Streptomyces venezuelae ATCC 10712]